MNQGRAGTTARALWFTAPRRAELKAEPLRAPSGGEILVESIVSLVSAGTELVMYRGESASAEESALPTAAGSFPFPLKYAYQIVGRVSAAGTESGFQVGDVVFSYHPHQEAFVIPVRAGGGTFGEATWPLVFKVPDGIAPDMAAFANLYCVALNCVLDVPIRVGDCVAVSGIGVIGTFAASLARRTAGRLILIDPLESRRERSAWIGADAVVAPEELRSAVDDLTEGRGLDIFIETSGAPAALQNGITATGQEGTIAVISYYGRKTVPLVLAPEFHLRRQRIVSSMVGMIGSGLQPRWTLERRMGVAMSNLARLDVEKLVSHRVPFADAAEAYQLLDGSPEDALGVLLEY
jgi:2-desacetyl-2-hydroxyethyl bacteriochlorophyllide A dehydrogenase